MKHALAMFELLVGFAFSAAVMFLFLSLAGISTPILDVRFFVYWGSLFLGPLLLIIGAVWTLITPTRIKAKITLLGALLVLAWSLYLVGGYIVELDGITLKSSATVITLCFLVLALLSVLAGYKLVREIR